MFDVFNEEIEVLIKNGIADLYWYKGDLHKAWVRAGAPQALVSKIAAERDSEGSTLTKRRQMDRLYEEIRMADYNTRLEISRNFVRTLIEHKNFVPHDRRHRIENAERSALKLRQLLKEQEEKREQADSVKRRAGTINSQRTYEQEMEGLRAAFDAAHSMTPHNRGYALERVVIDLMRISRIPVEEPFRVVGEQIDGAIKHEGRFYLLEVKWLAEKVETRHLHSLYMKVLGKFEAGGIFIAMSGFTSGAVESISKGKEIRLILLDGKHLANVIHGHYTFAELLNFALKRASLYGEVLCGHALV